MKKKQPTTYLKAYEDLKDQVAQGKPEPKEVPETLVLSRVRLCKPVFQHRQPEVYKSEAHIKELAKAPQHGKTLDPITVWWDGKGWVCVDGHHRIAAYQSANWRSDAIPVEVFRGTLEEAIARAAKGNTRDKLPMTNAEKTETAWRLTIARTSFSKAKIADLSGASERTVATMREVKAKLLEKAPQRDLSELTWARARMTAEGRDEMEIDWEEQTERDAQSFATILAKHLGKRGHQRREAFARALEIYDAALPAFLQEHWELNAEANGE